MSTYRRMVSAAVAMAAGLSLSASAQAPSTARQQSTSAQRDQISITVYNQNFGLVREVRMVDLTRGVGTLEFGDVASQIEPATVHLRALDQPGLRVLEQNYQFDLLSPQKLLEKYVGRKVRVFRWNEVTGRDEEREAEVLSVNDGTILKIGDEISFNYPGRISFPEIPKNLIARPTLVWTLQSDASRARLEVSYLTKQIDWKSDYVLVVNDDDTQGDLTGWITLTNRTGASYENARLKLVAGDVQRVASENEQVVMADQLRRAEAAAKQFTEEGFFEYHLYTLERPATLLENEQKQVTLLDAAGVGLEKHLVYYGAANYYRAQFGPAISNQKVSVYLDIQNTEKNHLGQALPKGTLRVYKADKSGAQQFVGEDRIDHTPRDEKLRIKLGEAFDVVGERRQMDFKAISSCVSESAWTVELRNHKDVPVVVESFEPAGGQWTILSSSQPAVKVDAHTFRFDVKVPARGETKVEYRVRVKWC